MPIGYNHARMASISTDSGFSSSASTTDVGYHSSGDIPYRAGYWNANISNHHHIHAFSPRPPEDEIDGFRRHHSNTSYNNFNTSYPHKSDTFPRHREFQSMSVSSASTTSSGASSISERRMSCSGTPESSSDGSSPNFSYSPLPNLCAQDGAVAKIEEMDDEDNHLLMNAPPLTSATEIPGKRGRGRPRKHPLPPLKAVQKVTKGRSKTGCITCRRRKKKCDETKPECMFITGDTLRPFF